jgi:hypothetical protein
MKATPASTKFKRADIGEVHLNQKAERAGHGELDKGKFYNDAVTLSNVAVGPSTTAQADMAPGMPKRWPLGTSSPTIFWPSRPNCWARLTFPWLQ